MSLRRRDERGATAVITAILSTVLLLAAALTVDIGQQRVVRTDMQAIADVASLDLSRKLDGRRVSELDTQEFSSELISSLDRNADNLGAEVLPLGRCDSYNVPINADVKNGACWDFVVQTDSGWDRAGTSARPEGIRVVARSEVSQAFGGVVGGDGTGGATRSAISQIEPMVCFSVGTDLVDLNTADNGLVQALESLLGIDLLNISTTAVGPGGIVALSEASVPLVDLATALEVGTVDGLVNTTEPISVGELLNASAAVLEKQTGDLAALDAALIFKALALQPALATPTLQLGDILALGPTGQSAVTAALGVGDLLNALVYVAGEHAVGATVPINVPLVGNVTATVSVIEVPKIACARPRESPAVEAESAQIRLQVDAPFPAGGSLVPALLTGIDDLLSGLFDSLLSTSQERVDYTPDPPGARLSLTVTSAHSTAKLRDPDGVNCADQGNRAANLKITSDLANVALGVTFELTKERRTRANVLSPWSHTLLQDWPDLPRIVATVASVSTSIGDVTPSDGTITESDPVFVKPETDLALNLDLEMTDDLAVLGLLGALVNPLETILLDPLTAALNATLLPVLQSVLGGLGIDLGPTTVRMSGDIECNPRLVQ